MQNVVPTMGEPQSHRDSENTMSSKLNEATFHTAGVPEVDVDFVHDTMGEFRLIDCREPLELVGPLGRIAGVENVPMAGLEEAAAEWGDEPIIILCRSGARSGRAAAFFESRGKTNVVSMAGGMIEWRGRGYPAE